MPVNMLPVRQPNDGRLSELNAMIDAGKIGRAHV